MAMEQLTLSMLKQFDLGKVDAAFAAELKAVVNDLRDRPTDKSVRKVMLTLELTPVAEEGTNDCDVAEVRFTIASKFPKRCTRAYQMGVKQNNTLMVNDLSPTDCRQGTLDGLDPGK